MEKKEFLMKQKGRLLLKQNIGNIIVRYSGEDLTAQNIMMEQPPAKFEQTFKDKRLVASLLSIKENEIMEDFPCRVVNCGNPFLIVPIKTLKSMERLKLDHDLFSKILDELFLTGILTFTLETKHPEHVSHSRMFAPHLGIPEDPATGSAHGPLAAYLHNYNLIKMTEIRTGEQGYEMGRPSQIKMKVGLENGKLSTILVGGECVFMGKGEIRIP